MKSFNLKFPASGYENRILSYPVILFLFLGQIIFYWFYFKRAIFLIDSPTYVSASDLVLQGIPDVFRTPIYPFFIGVFRIIFGNSWAIALVFFQSILFLLSGGVFYILSSKIVKNRKYVFWLTAFYLLYPGFVIYCFYIMTEAIAISGMTLFAYFIFRMLQNPKSLWNVLWMNLCLMFLIFLRPVFIFLLPIIAIIFIYQIVKLKPKFIYGFCGLIGLIFIGFCLFLYQKDITKRYGIHSISCVTVINNYFSFRYLGIIDPSLAPSPELKELVAKTFEKRYDDDVVLALNEVNEMSKQRGFAEIEVYEKELAKKYPYDLAQSILLRWRDQASLYPALPILPFDWKFRTLEILIPSTGTYFFCLLLYGIILIIQLKRYGSIPFFQFILLLICLGLYIVNAVGAPTDFSRLNVPAIPLAMILLGNFCASLKLKRIV